MPAVSLFVLARNGNSSRFCSFASMHKQSKKKHLPWQFAYFSSVSEWAASSLQRLTRPATYVTRPATYVTRPTTYVTRPATYVTHPATYVTRPLMLASPQCMHDNMIIQELITLDPAVSWMPHPKSKHVALPDVLPSIF
jgi:hypothetical protein